MPARFVEVVDPLDEVAAAAAAAATAATEASGVAVAGLRSIISMVNLPTVRVSPYVSLVLLSMSMLALLLRGVVVARQTSDLLRQKGRQKAA